MCLIVLYMHIYMFLNTYISIIVKCKSSNQILSLVLCFKMFFSLTSTLHHTSLVTTQLLGIMNASKHMKMKSS